MKLKLSCLLSVCLLMGSCSGGTSGNVSDSGTSASPSNTTNTNAYGENPAAVAAAQQYLNQAYNPSPATVAAAKEYLKTAPPSNSTIIDPVAQANLNLANSISKQNCGYVAGVWVCY